MNNYHIFLPLYLYYIINRQKKHLIIDIFFDVPDANIRVQDFLYVFEITDWKFEMIPVKIEKKMSIFMPFVKGQKKFVKYI